MTTNVLNAVRLEPAGDDNYFVRDRAADRLIGRVWREANGEWWATFYVGDAHSESGDKHETQDDAAAAVWTRAQKP